MDRPLFAAVLAAFICCGSPMPGLGSTVSDLASTPGAVQRDGCDRLIAGDGIFCRAFDISAGFGLGDAWTEVPAVLPAVLPNDAFASFIRQITRVAQTEVARRADGALVAVAFPVAGSHIESAMAAIPDALRGTLLAAALPLLLGGLAALGAVGICPRG